jgi:hypothetical protein
MPLSTPVWKKSHEADIQGGHDSALVVERLLPLAVAGMPVGLSVADAALLIAARAKEASAKALLPNPSELEWCVNRRQALGEQCRTRTGPLKRRMGSSN